MVVQPGVILIEDYPLIRASHRMLLEDAGCHVAEVASAAALATLEIEPQAVQAIIADYALGPGASGIDIAIEIMSRAGRRIPTLVLSASLNERVRRAAEAARMPVVLKPATDETLMTWVNETLAAAASGSGAEGDQAVTDVRPPWWRRILRWRANRSTPRFG